MISIIEPLQIFTNQHIINFGISNTKFLVGQTYFRRMGHDTNDTKIPVLLTPYQRWEEADFHFRKIKDDCLACVISWNAAKHRFTIGTMLHKTSRYRLFFAKSDTGSDARKVASRLFKQKIFAWISDNRNLHINPNEFVKVDFKAVEGIVMLIAQIQGKAFEMPLSDVEDYSGAASSRW